jgi:acyl carrier protein
MTRPELEQEYVAPRTEMEQALTNIFAEVLGIEKVGLHDNFFDLGGHSLLATQVASRIREKLKVDTSLEQLFDRPTVAELAEDVEQSRSSKEQAIDQITRLSYSSE